MGSGLWAWTYGLRLKSQLWLDMLLQESSEPNPNRRPRTEPHEPVRLIRSHTNRNRLRTGAAEPKPVFRLEPSQTGTPCEPEPHEPEASLGRFHANKTEPNRTVGFLLELIIRLCQLD